MANGKEGCRGWEKEQKKLEKELENMKEEKVQNVLRIVRLEKEIKKWKEGSAVEFSMERDGGEQVGKILCDEKLRSNVALTARELGSAQVGNYKERKWSAKRVRKKGEMRQEKKR